MSILLLIIQDIDISDKPDFPDFLSAERSVLHKTVHLFLTDAQAFCRLTYRNVFLVLWLCRCNFLEQTAF